MPIETLEQELKNPRLQAALASAWWSEEEAELILSALERSGLTVREFAKRTQVGAARLYSRRQQRTRPPNYILPPQSPASRRKFAAPPATTSGLLSTAVAVARRCDSVASRG